ncbi:MAG: RNA pseudouridine synthase [Saprospirales bacterium]|nr:MAG: RNA pseudouridine synthase [Saprospirales bacterium]
MMKREKYKILFEDNHLLAIEKPAGVLVHSDRTGDDTLLDWAKSYLRRVYNKPGEAFLQPVHRLDRPASGCQIFAKTSKAVSRMNDLFRNREIEKIYYCLSTGEPIIDKSELVHWLKKDVKKNRSIVKEKRSGALPSGWKEARLSLELSGSNGNFHLYRIVLGTGRPHQIRAQLAKSGAPLVGDLRYGGEKWQHPNAIALHCAYLSFIHPVSGETLTLSCLPTGQGWEFFVPIIKDSLR